MFYLVKVGVVLIAEASSMVQYLSVLAEGVREKQHMQPRRGHSFFFCYFHKHAEHALSMHPFPCPEGTLKKISVSEKL